MMPAQLALAPSSDARNTTFSFTFLFKTEKDDQMQCREQMHYKQEIIIIITTLMHKHFLTWQDLLKTLLIFSLIQ